ncbi:MMPL family transporter [Cellvibrio polysaccharolyticus]|uniref:Membrane transport protein MMPL domain-containing protein n=1 Tax=Cellvibrio polysaccharolyticus TaxID=2082724 RepID=A0A928UZ39_9GAMM|nr:hypothetical protein [Cellvibrio polysaccharolyticus]MBE8715876.1 hypothetical protein [Cellvibrio polysaccharolyticus]
MKTLALLRWLRYSFVAFALLAVLLCATQLPKLSFDNNILALFPDGDKTPAVATAEKLIAARISQKVFFLVSADSLPDLHQRLPKVANTLKQCRCFAEVSLHFDAEPWLALQAHYQPYAPQLLNSAQHQQLPSIAVEKQVNNTLRDLLTTPGVSITDRLQQDPFATLADYLDALRPGVKGVQIDEQGYLNLLVDGKRYVFFHAELSESPYSVSLQEAAQHALTEAKAVVADVPGVDWLDAGVLFYTMAGTEQARSEISTVGLGSLLGILVIFWWVFRSTQLLLLAFLPIAAGIALALAVCQWLFGSVHVISLIFGASLVGIAIDYALHFFTRRHAMGPQWQPEVCMQHLFPALTLGLLSSVLAYLGFTLSGFPGFTQVAIFSATGLITAWWIVVGLYPWWLRQPPRQQLPASLVSAVSAWRLLLIARLPQLLRWPWLLALAIFLALGLWQIRPLDDVRAMQIPDAELREREQRFQAATGQQMALQYVLVSGQQPEQLLQSLEALQAELDALKQQQVIGGYRHLAQWLPSQQQQDHNRQLWQQTFLNSGALEQLLDRLEVVPQMKTQLLQGYAGQRAYLPVEPTLALLNALPDAPLVFQQDDQWHAVVLLEKLTDTAPLAALASTHPQWVWVDIVGQTNQLLQQYRQGTLTLLLLAYGVIGLLFSWRYGLRGSLAILLPPLLSSLITLALSGWFGWPVSVFNMMALLLVLGIGIDAALFMRESGGRHYYTLVAIGISTVTTLLSFGLLSLSATAAIHSFGVTILIGISFCFILAPLAALSSRQHDTEEPKA